MTSGFLKASVCCGRKTDARTKFLPGARQQVQLDHLSVAANWWRRFSSGQEVSRSPPLVRGAPVLLIADEDDTKISVNINKSQCVSAG